MIEVIDSGPKVTKAADKASFHEVSRLQPNLSDHPGDFSSEKAEFSQL